MAESKSQPKTFTCYRCTMRFLVEKPHANTEEFHTCPECRLPFWSAKLRSAPPGCGRIRVGIYPKTPAAL